MGLKSGDEFLKNFTLYISYMTEPMQKSTVKVASNWIRDGYLDLFKLSNCVVVTSECICTVECRDTTVEFSTQRTRCVVLYCKSDLEFKQLLNPTAQLPGGRRSGKCTFKSTNPSSHRQSPGKYQNILMYFKSILFSILNSEVFTMHVDCCVIVSLSQDKNFLCVNAKSLLCVFPSSYLKLNWAKP